MTQAVRELMIRDVAIVPSTTTLGEAAQRMRDQNIGDVIVQDAPDAIGILTDRDITIRATAEGLSPDEVTVGEICTIDLATLGPDDPIDQAVALMRARAVRRLPVIERDRVVGIVSLGDLAVERDENSVLAHISAAEPQG
jgi:CBS domain-containing protein